MNRRKFTHNKKGLLLLLMLTMPSLVFLALLLKVKFVSLRCVAWRGTQLSRDVMYVVTSICRCCWFSLLSRQHYWGGSAFTWRAFGRLKLSLRR